jgi:hypothetical protein
VAQPLPPVGVATGDAEALGTGTGVAVPPFPLVGAAVGLALALTTGSGVAQDGALGVAVGLAVEAVGTADALAWAGFLLACSAPAPAPAPTPAVAADAQPANSATPATVPTAQAAVTRVLRVVTFICSSS